MATRREITVEGVKYFYSVGKRQTTIFGMGVYTNGSQIGETVDVSMDVFKVRPRDVEDIIRLEKDLPSRRLLKWRAKVAEEEAKPKPKKVDPGPRTRGFMNIFGKKIVAINTEAVNVVGLTTENGDYFEIEVEMSPNSIPIISCRKAEKQ